MFSRILGLARDYTWARLIPGASLDAFLVAFRLPNLFRRVLGEGAFNAAFVPLFAGRLEEAGPPVAKRFAAEALSVLLFVAFTLTALGADLTLTGNITVTDGSLQSTGENHTLKDGSTVSFP